MEPDPKKGLERRNPCIRERARIEAHAALPSRLTPPGTYSRDSVCSAVC
jgi:hypothetical protein